MTDGHVPQRSAHPEAESRTAIPPDAHVSFSLVLRYPPSKQRALDEDASGLLAGKHPQATRDEASAARSADPADVDRVRTFCERSGLTIDATDRESRTIRVSGPAGTVNALFHIVLMDARAGSRRWREYEGEPQVPAEIVSSVDAVLGLSTKPLA